MFGQCTKQFDPIPLLYSSASVFNRYALDRVWACCFKKTYWAKAVGQSFARLPGIYTDKRKALYSRSSDARGYEYGTMSHSLDIFKNEARTSFPSTFRLWLYRGTLPAPYQYISRKVSCRMAGENDENSGDINKRSINTGKRITK